MKRIFYLLFLMLMAISGFAQQTKYSKFYLQRASLFEVLPVYPTDIIFLGNSITNGNEWHELLENNNIKNRGISGDSAEGVYDRLDPIVKGKPQKIFLLIGTNDLQRGTSPDSVILWITRIIEKIKTDTPDTRLYVQSIMPVNDTFRQFSEQITNRKAIQKVNGRLSILCKEQNITFIDIFSGLKNKSDDKLDPAYTNDGLHLMGEGYLRWKELLLPYINGTPVVQVEQPVIPVLTHKEVNPVLKLTFLKTETATNSINNISFSMKGTTLLGDVDHVQLYYAGTNGMPDPAKPFSEAKAAATQLKFTDKLFLSSDTVILWATVKLKDKIDLTHRVNIICTAINTEKGALTLPENNAATGLRVGVALRQHMQDNIHTSRIPGLTTSKKGTLLAIYDGRRNSNSDLQGDIDICLNRSTDGGVTWQPLQVVLNKGKWGGLPEKFNGVSDACILADPKTGAIYVAGLWMHGVLDKETGKWTEGLNEQSTNWIHQWQSKGSQPGTDIKQTCQFLITKSTDDGKTWSEPVNITAQTKRPEWWLYAPAPGHGIALTDGTLVFPTQGRDENGVSFSNITWSKDGGKTWTASNPAYKDVTECMVVQLTDGSLMLNMRDNRNRGNLTENGRRICTTTNLGETWTEHPTSRKALIEPTCMASLHRHTWQGKSLLLFSNPSNESIRTHMTLKASTDNGNTWLKANQTELDEYRSAGYSCITSVNENSIGILYESSQAQLVYQQIPVSELMGNSSANSKK